MPSSGKKVKVQAESTPDKPMKADDARVAAGIELFRQALNESDAAKWEEGAKLLMRPDPESLVPVKDDDGDSDDDDFAFAAPPPIATTARDADTRGVDPHVEGSQSAAVVVVIDDE